jgi:hypothetical protein
LAFGRRVYVPGDPEGKWTVVTRAIGGQAVELGVGTSARVNPLDDGPRPSGVDDGARRAQVRGRRVALLAALAEATLGRPLRATERTSLDTALDTARSSSSVPVLPKVVDPMLEPEHPFAGLDGRPAPLGRTLGCPRARSTGPRGPRRSLRRAVHGALRPDRADAVPRPVGDLRVGHVDRASDDVRFDLDGGHARRSCRRSAAGRLRRGVAVACAAGPARPHAAQWKLSRAWGLANLIVLHRLSDLDAVGDIGSEARGLAQGLLGDTATRILYNEPFEEAQAAGKVLGLTSVEIEQLPELARGEGLWRVNERAFIVRHICTPDELSLFDTDARI